MSGRHCQLLGSTVSGQFLGTGGIVGNNKYMQATMEAKKKGTVVQKDGKTMDVVMKKYLVVPDLWVNLYALNVNLEDDWKLGNEGKVITVAKNNKKLKFDWIIPTGKGHVTAVDILPRTEVANPTLAEGSTVDINTIHDILGHQSEEILRKSAKFYNVKVTGKLKPCEYCSTGKARKKRVGKETET